jgi:hypothetical protein
VIIEADLGNQEMKDLSLGINLFALKNWRCVNITSTGVNWYTLCYVLMERIEPKYGWRRKFTQIYSKLEIIILT